MNLKYDSSVDIKIIHQLLFDVRFNIIVDWVVTKKRVKCK